MVGARDEHNSMTDHKTHQFRSDFDLAFRVRGCVGLELARVDNHLLEKRPDSAEDVAELTMTRQCLGWGMFARTARSNLNCTALRLDYHPSCPCSSRSKQFFPAFQKIARQYVGWNRSRCSRSIYRTPGSPRCLLWRCGKIRA